MFVKTLAELKANGEEIAHGDGKLRAIRFLTRRDGMGVSFSDVRCGAGLDEILWYKHHWEANYVVEGRGTLEDLSSGQVWQLESGDVYTVGPKDRHRVHVDQYLHATSIFNPPLTGTEAYDEDGSFEPSGEVLPGRDTLFVKRLSELRKVGQEKLVVGGSARSTRMLLQEDNVGFTLSDVTMAAGKKAVLWNKHHWEANYILHGRGIVSDLASGESWILESGTMYIVGPDDRHSIEATTDLHLISILNPPLQGDEQYDDEGSLPSSGPLPTGMRGNGAE